MVWKSTHLVNQCLGETPPRIGSGNRWSTSKLWGWPGGRFKNLSWSAILVVSHVRDVCWACFSCLYKLPASKSSTEADVAIYIYINGTTMWRHLPKWDRTIFSHGPSEHKCLFTLFCCYLIPSSLGKGKMSCPIWFHVIISEHWNHNGDSW